MQVGPERGKGRRKAGKGGSLWQQVLRAQTLNKRGGGGQAVMGLCYHIPETPAFPFHKGGRRGQLHTIPPRGHQMTAWVRCVPSITPTVLK